MNERADKPIGQYAGRKSENAQKRIFKQQCGRNAADKSHKRPDGKIEIIHRDDEHLGYGGQRYGHRILQHQIEPEIAHGARLNIKGGCKHDSQ